MRLRDLSSAVRVRTARCSRASVFCMLAMIASANHAGCASREPRAQRSEHPTRIDHHTESSGEVAMQSPPESDQLTLVQLTLDLPQLRQYYHVDQRPERSPLIVVAGEDTLAAGQLQQFSRPVVLERTTEAAGGKPYLRIDRVDVRNGGAQVDFAYPPEGISGHVEYRREDDSWSVVKVNLVER